MSNTLLPSGSPANAPALEDAAAAKAAASAALTDVDPPVMRPLKAYALDPAARLLGNEMTLNVRYQELEPGPVVKERAGDSIAIVDYDGANGTYYKPVNLDDPRILIRGGLNPSESDPRFHQQMVYAVVTETIQHFETALGRRIHWRRGDRNNENYHLEHIWTLNIYPHAFIGKNAFYSPKAHGILFGYFRAGEEKVGRNLPGQTVFTCLSHDVVVHETTHAIVDGIRTYFTERTNPDVLAFHEAFADLAALFRHFTHGEMLRDTIERTGGALYKYQLNPDAAMSTSDKYATSATAGTALISAQLRQRNPLIELAQQFGEATGREQALRSALSTEPNSDDIKKITEPHFRGSILVAAVFDAFFAIYIKRTADLWRIFRAGGGRDNPTDIPRPLADRLCEEATRLSEQFFQICVRALDYCPPVDITFGTYLRAIITADFDLHPRDEVGIRDALMQSFRLRGIVPEGAGSFSEGAIAWPRAYGLEPVAGLDFGDANGLTNQEKNNNGRVLREYANRPETKRLLGFDPDEVVFAPSFHPVFRINTDGSLRTDMVVELVQTRRAPLNKDAPGLGTFPVRGGTTLIIQKPGLEEMNRADRETQQNRAADPEAPAVLANAQIRYAISRKLEGAEGILREARQRRHIEQSGLAEGNDAERFRIDFAMAHGGM
jgi:hypothetical protein